MNTNQPPSQNPENSPVPEEIKEVPILYQDDAIIVVNKPPFMMVHPWRGGPRHEKALMTVVKEQTGHWLYPVHRLDRQSSGAVLFALKSEYVTFFKDRWHNETEKKYMALGNGAMPVAGYYDHSLKSQKGVKQEALTLFEPLEYFDHHRFGATLCEVSIKTGRKHQIRRHFSRNMHCLVGDTRYGKGRINDFFRENYQFHRLYLHSHFLKFPHPTENKMVEIHAPLTEDLQLLNEALFKKRF